MRSVRSAHPAPWRNRIVGHADLSPADLVPNPRNWRTHPQEQERALSGSLGEVGWVAEVLVNRTTGHVVDGHLRIELALARHEPVVPVTYVDLTEDEEGLVLATLDPLAAMADAESSALAELLAGLDPADEALRALLDDLAREHGIEGFNGGPGDPDDVPDLPEEPYVQPGELWALGGHRLLCGDATSPDDVSRLLGSATPTLLVTDPPYGVSLDPTWRDGVYNELGPAEKPYMRTKGHRNTTVSGDTRIDWSEPYALVPSLAVGYVWHAGIHAAAVADGLGRIGFEIVAQAIWDKGLFAIRRSWYHWGHEPCWIVRRMWASATVVGDEDPPSPRSPMDGVPRRRSGTIGVRERKPSAELLRKQQVLGSSPSLGSSVHTRQCASRSGDDAAAIPSYRAGYARCGPETQGADMTDAGGDLRPRVRLPDRGGTVLVQPRVGGGSTAVTHL